MNINKILATSSLTLFLSLSACSCSHDKKSTPDDPGEKPENPGNVDGKRPETFANDDEMLDYIQKTHLNYMWEGA
ncbi:MAG: beta-glucosidase, partial [Muribaculaceae bacterium]|nr:beta-glucosidase [Muribaculaceae bacterium]